MFWNHILSFVVFVPLGGGLAVMFLPAGKKKAVHWTASAAALLALLISLLLIGKFHAVNSQFQFIEDVPWVPSIGIHYTLGIDAISLLMVILTTILAAISVLFSRCEIRQHEKEYYFTLLLLQTCMLGVFTSLDLALFYAFWEAALIPLYLLIGSWSNDRRADEAMKFLIYILAGSIAMLGAILALYSYAHTFSMRAILESTAPILSAHAQRWLFMCFFFAFAIGAAMFPFHTWFVDALVDMPASASVMLAGVFLKMGTYGLLRFCAEMFPDGAMFFRSTMIVLAVAGIVYGALVCLAQIDVKKVIAWASVSQMGLCTLGIFILTPLGLAGSVVQQLSHGISIGAFLLIAAVLYSRLQSRTISDFGGLAESMPRFAATYLAITLSIVGIPLLSGFAGEFVILREAFELRWQWAACGVLGMILVAVSLISMYHKISFAPPASMAAKRPADLNVLECGTMLPLLALVLWIGIYPAPIFRLLDAPVSGIANRYEPAGSHGETVAQPAARPLSAAIAPAASDSQLSQMKPAGKE